MSMSSPAPADDGAPALLLSIPVECRHILYGHVAATRTVKPRDTLRYWFEKQDIQEQIAENVSNDPDANVTYTAGYNHRDEEDDEVEDEDGQEVALVDAQDDDDEYDDEDDEEDDEDDEDDEGDDEDGEGDEDDVNEVIDEILAAVDQVASAHTPQQLSAVAHAMMDEPLEDVVEAAGQSTATADTAQDGSVTMTANPADTDLVHGQDVAAEDTEVSHINQSVVDVDMVDNQEDEDDAQEPVEEMSENAHTVDGNGDEATADPTPPAPKVVVVKPSTKWRHVPKFMRLDQCPPETNLFLISKQLNSEVKAWFYDVATLKINATASFLHFSFFELALNKLAEAPFSPMENIKKAEITFVWDSTWIHAEESGFAGAVFPALLQDRANFILEILLRAPELESVFIHWHDSAEDDGAKQLRADTLEPFILNLKAKVDTQDHYITPDAKPRAKSRAGKQRLEFKAIIDNGCETF